MKVWTARASPHGRHVLALAFAEIASWGILYYAYAVLLRPMTLALSASEPVVAGAFSIALLTSGLAARRVGRAVDRWGARRVMTAAALVAAVAFALLATVTNLVQLYLLWAVLGVAQAGVLYEPAFAALTSWFPRERERVRALLVVTSLGGLASTVFLPLTAWLLTMFGLRLTLLALGAVLAVFVVPLHALLPGARLPRRTGARVVHPRPRGLALVTIVFAMHAFASAGAAVYLVSHLESAGASIGEAASAAGVVGLAQVAGRLLSGPLRSMIGSRGRLPVLLAAQATALVLVTGELGVATGIAVLLFGAANGLVTIERATIIAERFGTERYGETSGRIARVALLARAGAPVAVGVLKAHAGFGGAFLGLAALLAAGAFMALRAGAREKSADRSISCVHCGGSTSSENMALDRLDLAHLALRADVRRFIARRVDPSVADDLVQDVFLRVQERAGELRDADRVAPWLFRIARNVVIDHWRRQRTRSHASLEDVDEPTTPETELNFNDEMAAWLKPMMDLLPQEYRAALELTEIEGLTQRELADRTGLSLSGAKSRVQRARQLLEGIVRACCDVEVDTHGNVVACNPRNGACRSC